MTNYIDPVEAYRMYREYETSRLETENSREQAINEATNLQRNREFMETYTEPIDKMALDKKLASFRENLYKGLVAECVGLLAASSIKDLRENEEFDYERDSAIVKKLAESWANDKALYQLKNVMNSTSFLSTLNLACEQTVEEACNKAKKKLNDGEKDEKRIFKLDADDKEQFYQKIDAANADELIYTIKTRVADANQEFIDSYMKDKMEIKSIMSDTKSMVDALKAESDPESVFAGTGFGSSENIDDDPDDPFNKYNQAPTPAAESVYVTNESLQLEYAERAKDKIREIMNKPICPLFESMVVSLSTAAYKNKALNEEFITENTQLNTEGVRNRTAVMYAFLETLNTAKLEKITPEYCEDLLKEIKNM